MRQLDYQVKSFEIANLPVTARQLLFTDSKTEKGFYQALQSCGERLNRISLRTPDHKKSLIELTKIPDAYDDWKRAVGLYPLARYFAMGSLDRLHQGLKASFNVPIGKLPFQGRLLRYFPPDSKPLMPAQIAEILHAAYGNDPLQIPKLNALQFQQLQAHFAPVWEIDTHNHNDRPGNVSLSQDGEPHVDIAQPTVYVDTALTRWQGKILLQLIYQIWFPEREKTGEFDLYGGLLDSVIWRVTLSPKGEPIAFDSVHGCGCYYMLFPSKGYRSIPPKDNAEPILSPTSLPVIHYGSRLLLRLQSRTHYLQQVALINSMVDTGPRNYIYNNLDGLRSMPLPNGARQSLYGNDGIVGISTRTERFFLWPFGVRSPGAMRQWGTHAIAFIGKRHFDDPFLFENFLEMK